MYDGLLEWLSSPLGAVANIVMTWVSVVPLIFITKDYSGAVTLPEIDWAKYVQLGFKSAPVGSRYLSLPADRSPDDVRMRKPSL